MANLRRENQNQGRSLDLARVDNNMIGGIENIIYDIHLILFAIDLTVAWRRCADIRDPVVVSRQILSADEL